MIGFIYLFITASQKYVTITEIKTSDVSDTNGWNCITISKSNMAFTIDANVEPSQNYNLVNVMETPSEMSNDLNIANPCDHQEFIPGSRVPYDFKGGGAKYIAYSPNGTFLSLYTSGSQYYLLTYVDDGTNNTDITPVGSGSQYYGLAVDANDIIWLVSKDSAGFYFEKYGNIDDDVANVYLYYGDEQPYLFVDNLNNMYYLLTDGGICYVYSFDSSSGTYINTSGDTLVWSYTCDKSVGDQVYSAVYDYGTGSENIVYYGVSTVDGNSTFMKNVNGMTTVVFFNYDLGDNTNYKNYPMLATDIYGTIYYGWGDAVERYVPGIPSTNGTYDIMPYMIAPVLNLVFNPTYSVLAIGVGRPFIKFVDMSNPSSTTSETFEEMTKFGLGFFTCGANMTSPIPIEVSSYAPACQDNGIVGATLYKQTYYFTTSSAETFAISNAAPYCDSYAAAVLSVSEDLPPYSCARKVYPTVFAAIGSAFANAQLLLLILVGVFAFLLDKLSTLYPPDPKEVIEDELDNDTHKDIESSGGGGLEMNAVTENPLLIGQDKSFVTMDMLQERCKLLQPPVPLPEKIWKYFKKTSENYDIDTKLKMRGILAANQDNIAEVFVSSTDEERESLLEQLSVRKVNPNPPAALPEKTWKYFKKCTENLKYDTSMKLKMRGILAANENNIAEVFVSSTAEERDLFLNDLSLQQPHSIIPIPNPISNQINTPVVTPVTSVIPIEHTIPTPTITPLQSNKDTNMQLNSRSDYISNVTAMTDTSTGAGTGTSAHVTDEKTIEIEKSVRPSRPVSTRKIKKLKDKSISESLSELNSNCNNEGKTVKLKSKLKPEYMNMESEQDM